MSFPKSFKYRTSVSMRTNEIMPIEETERRGLTVLSAKDQSPFPQRDTSRDVEYVPNDRQTLRPWWEREGETSLQTVESLVNEGDGEDDDRESTDDVDPGHDGRRPQGKEADWEKLCFGRVLKESGFQSNKREITIPAVAIHCAPPD